MNKRHKQITEQARSADKLHILNPKEHGVLTSLARYHFLTAPLLGWLLGYSPKSARYVQKLLESLATTGYLLRTPLPRFGRYGQPAAVYCLSRKGINYLKACDIPVKERFHPSEQRDHSFLFLQHTLDLNAVLIGAERLCRSQPALTFAALRHERELKGQVVPVQLPTGATVTVCPDAWLDLRQGTEQLPLVLEYDRATEHKAKWSQRTAALLTWATTVYADQFGTPYLTIAVLAGVGGAQRRDTLKAWTETVLTELGAHDQADLFRFAALPDHPTAAQLEALFGTSCWFAPFASQPEPLISLDVEAP